jgi:hypothetical protein
MGCGWLPPSTSAPFVWTGPRNALKGLTTCAGYTAQLPDVLDIARLYWWAENGNLPRSKQSAGVVDGIDLLRSSIADVDAYAIELMKEKNRGPG